MQTPVEIDFLGSNPPEPVRQAIEEHVSALEKRFGRITSCRVAVEAPSGRHRTSGLNLVRIHLALPNGTTVDIDHVDNDDERLSDLTFAVNHAFKRARRRLQDRVGRMQDQAKAPAPETPTGSVE